MDNKMTNIIPIIAFILLLLFAIVFFQYTARYVYNYVINDTGIVIVLFGKIPLKRMDFNNIAEIRKTSYKETFSMVSALRFGNRIWGDIVLVRQKKGIIKTVLITPDNADKFIFGVQQQLHK